jgi:hypothetical protein
MHREQYVDLPYFDDIGNDYVRELQRQDSFLGRGGKLSAPQMIKYENRVAMLVERLLLILEAVKQDADDLRDYLHSIEQAGRRGTLPKQVYTRFKEKIEGGEKDHSHRSERDRDRFRVISGSEGEGRTELSDASIPDLLDMHRRRRISHHVLFEELEKREKEGHRLPKMDPRVWGRYRSWLSERRRTQKS